MKDNNLQGKSYLLTKDQSAILSEKFNLYGIPRYIIIDKNGNIVDENAKRPYSGALKTELMELMEMV